MDAKLLAWGLRRKPSCLPRLWLFTDDRRLPDHLIERHRIGVLGVSPTLIRALMAHGDAPVDAHGRAGTPAEEATEEADVDHLPAPVHRGEHEARSGVDVAEHRVERVEVARRVRLERDDVRVVVADGEGGVEQPAARGRVQVEGGGDLHDLLVAALDRAVTLEQMDKVAVLVAQHLHLNVAGPGAVLFEEDIGALSDREGFRTVKVTVKVPLPETATLELEAEAPELEAPAAA